MKEHLGESLLLKETEAKRSADDSSSAALSKAPATSSTMTKAPAGFKTHVIWTLVTRLVMVAGSVCAGVLVARWLGAEGFGQLSVINISVATMVQLGSAGLSSANIYFISRERSMLAPVAINSTAYALLVGIMLTCGMILLAGWRPRLFGAVSPALITVAALSIPFQLFTLLGLNIFLAVGSVGRFNVLDVAGQSFVLINAVLALILLRRGLGTLITLNTLAALLISLLIVWLIYHYIKDQDKTKRWWCFRAELLWRSLRYGIKFHISMLASMLIFRADLLVVNFYRGAAEAGVYGVASQMALMLMLLPGVIATLLFPRAASADQGQAELTCVVTRRTALLMAVICLLSVPLSFALPLVYGTEFRESVVQLLILLPGVYLISIESVLVQYFNAVGLPFAIPVCWLVTLGVNLTLVFALVPLYGARGAALSSTISYALIFALVALLFRARAGKPLSAALLPRAADLHAMLTLKRSTLASR